MKHKHFFPTQIAGQRAWLVNHKAQIAIVGPGLGLPAAQITAVQNACQLMIAEIDSTDAALITAKAKVANRETMIFNQMGTIRPLISTIKNSAAYNDTIGLQLEIIGSEVIVDNSSLRTLVKLTITPQGPELKFAMENCEAANIYCKRGTETEFTLLKMVTHSHAIDTRPNLNNAATEKREYYVILVINDLEVGIPSATEAINY